MDAAERLLAIEEIKQLKARYFRCMDTKDWDGFAAVFAPDADMDVSGEVPHDPESGLRHGNTAIAAFVRSNVDPVVTVHHGHMPEITVHDEDTASGIWSMEDKLRWPDGSSFRTLHGYGHYHETYRRVDGQWRIQTLRLTRLRLDVGTA